MPERAAVPSGNLQCNERNYIGRTAMDLTPYIGTIVTVIIAVGSVYAAIASRLARLETLIVDNDKMTQSQIADLRRDVEKHNSVIERTYKLESDVNTAFKRIDELKEADKRLEDRINHLV
jgi:Na+/H+ antiporter NhaB